MKYYLVVDFGTKVEVESKKEIPAAFGYKSWKSLEDANGGAMPDIVELTEDDYNEEDEYDVI